MKKLIVILGPTCTGKTSLAEELCLKHNGEIVSADSRQVYQYMDIGTGKLPKSEQVVTHLQDVAVPGCNYSVSDWSKTAHRTIKNIWQRGKIPFVVGGTGFYIDVLLGNKQLSGVEPDYILRAKLEKLSTEELFEKLKKLDSERAASIDSSNERRLVRAIEIAECSSPTPNSNSTSISKILIVGLKAPNKYLYSKADRWVEKILEKNILFKETANLIERGYKDTSPLQGIIYKSVIDHFDHKLDYDEMKQRIKYDLHSYIRRQLTWFKKSPPNIKWFNISETECGQKVKNAVRFYLDG